jgi:hypothetical protein
VAPLILTLILTTLAAFALLWAIGFTLQTYLYERVTDHLILRAAIGGILLGGFYTFWVFVNTRAEYEDKYGVLNKFSPTARSEIGEFSAVRQFPNVKGPDGKPKEETTAYKKSGSGRTARFVDLRNMPFKRNDSQFITTALEINDAGGKTTRFDAVLNAQGQYEYPNGRSARFVETGGKRFIEEDNPGLVFAPSTSALIGAILLNVMNYAIWVVAFWPCLRFTLGHSIGGAFGFGTLMMLMVVPLLFEQNQVKPRVADVPPITTPEPKPA